MAQSIITWTAAGGTNSLSQLVQYKLSSSSTWVTFSTLAAGVGTETITGLVVNQIYDFRVVDNCAVGGPIPSQLTQKIKFNCPSITVTPTFNSVSASFPNMYGDITKYVVQLLDSTGNSVLNTSEITDISPSSFTKVFSSLTSSTTYNIRITMYAGTTFDYSNICTMQSFTTGTTPVCLPPVGISAVMS
jgi:hypothetical protein